MIVKVSGLERFLGHIKRIYTQQPTTSEHPEQHHDAYAANLQNATEVGRGVTFVTRSQLVSTWEQDPRWLIADLVALPDGRISYRLYEVPR